MTNDHTHDADVVNEAQPLPVYRIQLALELNADSRDEAYRIAQDFTLMANRGTQALPHLVIGPLEGVSLWQR